MQLKFSAEQNLPSRTMIQEQSNSYSMLIPGLPEDLAKLCLALVPRSHFPVMGSVSKSWMEQGVYRCSEGGREARGVDLCPDRWSRRSGKPLGGAGEPGSEELDQKKRILPPMPGPKKAGFGVVVLDGKLFAMAGYAADHGKEFVSDEAYRYDACLNRWTALAKMNVARRDFACAEVNGVIYAAGGFGPYGDSLSSVGDRGIICSMPVKRISR